MNLKALLFILFMLLTHNIAMSWHVLIIKIETLHQILLGADTVVKNNHVWIFYGFTAIIKFVTN